MASNLSLSDDSTPGGAGNPSGLAPTSNGAFERMLIGTLCVPLLVRLPARVHPNHISLFTHCIGWITAACAIGSAHLPRPYQSMALVGAGIGMLLQMIGDCLDGMHARRTNQCSKLGEMMDHWLDAIVVPLATVGITMALNFPPWAMVFVNVTATMVYQAQLVLYHHTGKFVHPEPASGVEAQFGVSVGYLMLSVLFYFVSRQAPWIDVALSVIAVLGIVVQLRCNWFYYPKLGRHIWEHFLFAGYLFAFGGLYLLGAMNVFAFVVLLVFTSFRISGSYVLYSTIGMRYFGRDRILELWIAAMALAHVAVSSTSTPVLYWLQALPYAAGTYLVARTLLDFVQHRAKLTR